ncbi:MAG: zinc ribbon domain-containing protein [Chloroflexi bacterium]|nr:zinc ribbon domain-containing protein [Chloroflexota bacterium]
MEIIFTVVLAGVAIAAAGYPLFKARTEEALTVAGETAMESLRAQRDAVYASIKELDFDHEMGNLSGKDHTDLRERYTRKAVAILKALDEQPKLAPVVESSEALGDEDEIEREVAAVRQARRAGVGVDTGAPIPSRHQPKQVAVSKGKPATLICSRCGMAYDIGDAFCRHCGAALSRSCSSCGAVFQEGDRFCARCGQKL